MIDQMEDDLARAQQARVAAEATLLSARAAAEVEANALRQQLLQALQKARDAELRASHLHERAECTAKEHQVREGLSVGAFPMQVSRNRRSGMAGLKHPMSSCLQMSESQLVDKIRDQLSAAETALVTERASAESIRSAATDREKELQAQLSMAAAELSAAQQAAEAQATELATTEERLSIMERDYEAQAAELATVQERLRR